MKRLLLIVALTVGLVGIACAPLKPGADPLVVRAEQVEQSAAATFDLFLNADDLKRDWFKANAPEAHKFAEWLRAPQPWGGTNQPRAIVLVLNLNNVKSAYKSSRSLSNVLESALVTLQASVAQAAPWITSTNR